MNELDLQFVVFYTSQEKDLPYLAAAIRSLAAHIAEPKRLEIYVLYTGLDGAGVQRLRDSVDDLECPTHSHDIGSLVGDRVGRPGFGYWAYLWMVEVLPLHAEKALYLDCDILVYDDISPLLQIELGDSLLAAAVDPGARVLQNQATLCEWAQRQGVEYDPKRSPYVNAGVLLFNLRLWREERILEFLDQRFGDDYQTLRYHDQDAINLLLGNRIKLVSPRWNLLEPLGFWEGWDFEIQTEDTPLNYFEPAIKHFAGPQKPDTEFIRQSDREHYYRYLDQTYWRGQRHPAAACLRGKLIAELLEFRYLLVRGFQQKVLRDPRARLFIFLKRAPYVPLLYPAIYLHRLSLKIRRLMHGLKLFVRNRTDWK